MPLTKNGTSGIFIDMYSGSLEGLTNTEEKIEIFQNRYMLT